LVDAVLMAQLSLWARTNKTRASSVKTQNPVFGFIPFTVNDGQTQTPFCEFTAEVCQPFDYVK